MSERHKNHVMIILGVITAFVTVCVQMVSVGDLKGTLTTSLADLKEVHADVRRRVDGHEARLGSTEGDVKSLKNNVSNIESRLHGIATQIGKVPNKVAAKIQDDE